jgi:hypothetical protein
VRTTVRRRQTRSGVRWYVSVLDDESKEHAQGGFRPNRAATAKAAAILTDAERNGLVPATTPDTILSRWRRLVKAAKVPAIPLHGARHSYRL